MTFDQSNDETRMDYYPDPGYADPGYASAAYSPARRRAAGPLRVGAFVSGAAWSIGLTAAISAIGAAVLTGLYRIVHAQDWIPALYPPAAAAVAGLVVGVVVTCTMVLLAMSPIDRPALAFQAGATVLVVAAAGAPWLMGDPWPTAIGRCALHLLATGSAAWLTSTFCGSTVVPKAMR